MPHPSLATREALGRLARWLLTLGAGAVLVAGVLLETTLLPLSASLLLIALSLMPPVEKNERRGRDIAQVDEALEALEAELRGQRDPP